MKEKKCDWFLVLTGAIKRCLSSPTLFFPTFLQYFFFTICNILIDIFIKFSCYFFSSVVVVYAFSLYLYPQFIHSYFLHNMSVMQWEEKKMKPSTLSNPSPAPLSPDIWCKFKCSQNKRFFKDRVTVGVVYILPYTRSNRFCWYRW